MKQGGINLNKRVLVLGGTGMLGSAIAKHFLTNKSYDTVTTCRDKSISIDDMALQFDAMSDSLEILPQNFDYVINCIGVIKPFMSQDPVVAIKINALFPWIVAQWCEENAMRLIHITTDCVYSGNKGKYVESDEHDALDAYGKSKSLGECSSLAMVIRTSIIGEEIHNGASLIEWAKRQKGKTVQGYSTHYWNGVTTKEYAAACEKIIEHDWYEKGLFHIFAQDDVSKLQMLQYFNNKFNLDLTIEKSAPEPIDRTMRTQKEICSKLEIPTVEKMIMAI